MRTKKALLNFLSDAIPFLIIGLIGLVKLELLQNQLGDDLAGINGLYVNYMVYLTALDGGLGAALLYRLYGPIASHDQSKINAVLSGGRRIFNIIAMMMLIAGFILSFFVFYMVKLSPDSTVTYRYMQVSFIFYLVSMTLPYFFIASKSMFEADQRKYVVNNVTQAFLIFKSIMEVVILNLGCGLIELYLLLGFCNLMTALIIYFYSKRVYKDIDYRSKEKDYTMLKDVKNLLVNRIGTMVAYNIDGTLIGIFLGAYIVPFYQAYQYITDNLMTLIGKITYSVTAGVGEVLIRDQKRAYEIFDEFNCMSFFIANIVCVPLVYAINPFIDIWRHGRFDTTMLMAVCFVAQLFYYVIRMPLIAYTNAGGLFRETRKCSIIESVVNLTLSVILIQRFGIPGILVATFISYIVSDYLIKPKIIYERFFEAKVSTYYKKNAFFVLLMLAEGFLLQFIVPYLSFDGYLMWFISSCIIFGINFVITCIVYMKTHQAMFMNRFIAMVKR